VYLPILVGTAAFFTRATRHHTNEEAIMGAKPYGPSKGEAPHTLAEYHQSKDELAGLPVTVAEKIPVTNTPNIFSYRSYVFAKNPALVQRFIKATKADVGGVGGHVVAADEVKSTVAKYVLDNNAYRGEPMFTSLIVTHTGDDVAVTGIVAESVDMGAVDELMWDALQEGAGKAAELGLYGPGQDLVADAFTGNLRGAGPATVALPFPVRKENASQTVLLSFADKTEPMAFNYFATGAYLLPRFNTGLIIASSRMKRGYLFDIVDLDTKAQAVEAGAHPRDQKALDGKMEEIGKGLQEKVITLRAPEDLYDIEGLCRSSRFVIARIWTRGDDDEPAQLGYVCSAERLHNIKTKKGFTYGGKDDPVLLAFAQGDWPAPGEITSPWATCPMVAGDCRGSHNLHILPVPINSQTSFWSGPILSTLTLSCNIHTGRIGAISDQFALGTPWDQVRRQAGDLAIQFRNAHGVKQPATLHEDELEYQEGWKERRARLEGAFTFKPAFMVGGHRNGHASGNGHAPAEVASGRGKGRPSKID
jgi:fructose 1,6-bisphosphate aldolase/phosphatase